MVRMALRRWWTDRCDVFLRESTVCSESGRSVFTERKVYADLPCRVSFRISFETVGAVRDVGTAAVSAGQAVRLFLAPDAVVPPGSRIVVRRQGQEMVFWRTGVPVVFLGHQEIRMERVDRWT
ncbi:MAG: hypothetical protein FWE12_04115 [Oscillospiraceae bacterium]|nr:hypothetical protein [Oscillospiraceae bacterium]